MKPTEKVIHFFLNVHLQEKICQTQPPPRSSHRDYCNQWIIYDAYAKDKENQPKGTSKQDALAEAEAGNYIAKIADCKIGGLFFLFVYLPNWNSEQCTEKEAGEGEEKKEEKKPVKKEKEAGK